MVGDHFHRHAKAVAEGKDITTGQKQEGAFLRFCNWVSRAMGEPPNITGWAIFVVAWTVIFAAHIVPASGSFLPSWFTGQGYNFPLNLLTTVAELFIGFFVAAATNRAQTALEAVIDGIALAVKNLQNTETKLVELIEVNTKLTEQVHELTSSLHQRVTNQASSAQIEPS